MKTCCICGKVFEGRGNNPQPVKEEGSCCDDCNSTVVIPARLYKPTKKKTVQFDSTDWPGMRDLMDRHTEFDEMLFSTNQNGEPMRISIFESRIICIVYQHNRWIRRMVYWRNGTVEELYEGRWEV